MFLIVGLGNPGPRYQLTRHNVGFMVIDALADHLRIPAPTEQFKALVGKTRLDDHDLCLVKPQTYMNLSGESVQGLMAYYKIPLENLLVIHDDIDQSFGEIKFQKNRGHGGHNGVRNIHEKIGSDYARLKLGVGRPTIPQMDVADYVLQNFAREQESKLAEFIGQAADAALDFVEFGFAVAQNKYN